MVAQPPPQQQVLAIPSPEELLALIRTTIIALNQANMTGNYTVLRDIGAFTIGQDESTSVVWGMPAAAQEADAVDLELPLPAIGQAIVTAVHHAVEDVVEVGS